MTNNNIEKSILILGVDDYDYYYGVHKHLEKIGIGITSFPNIITLSNRGVSNHVYFYYRYNNLLNKYTSYFNTKFKIKDLINQVSEVYVFGEIENDSYLSILNILTKENIPVKKIQL